MTQTIERPLSEVPIQKAVLYNDATQLIRATTLKLENTEELIVEITGIPRQGIPTDSITVSGRGAAVLRQVQIKEEWACRGDHSDVKALSSLTELWTQVRDAQNKEKKALLEVNQLKKKQLLCKSATKAALLALRKQDCNNYKKASELIENHRNIGTSIVKSYVEAQDAFEIASAEAKILKERLDAFLGDHFREYKSLRETSPLDADPTALRNIISKDLLMTYTVKVLLKPTEPCDAELLLRYTTYSASWNAAYDFRVKGSEETREASLDMFALIRNETEENWSNVPVELFAGHQTNGLPVPEAPNVVIDLKDTADPKFTGRDRFDGPGRNAENTAKYTFDEPISLASHSEKLRRQILHMVTPATLLRIAVPERASQVLLAAVGKNTGDLPLMQSFKGVAVYVENAYIGQTSLDLAVESGQEFFLTVGEEPAVKLHVNPPVKHEKKVGLIQSSTCTQFQESAALENVGAFPVPVVVVHQFPLSVDARVTVNLKEPTSPHSLEDVTDTKAALKLLSMKGRHSRLAGINTVTNHILQLVEVAPQTKETVSVNYTVDCKEPFEETFG